MEIIISRQNIFLRIIYFSTLIRVSSCQRYKYDKYDIHSYLPKLHKYFELGKFGKVFGGEGVFEFDYQIASINASVYVTNLNLNLSPFVGKHCLTVLDNFQNIGFGPLEEPIILRIGTPAMFVENGRGWQYPHLGWVANHKTHYNESFPICSKLFYKRNLEICLRLHPNNFITKTRPWNCEVQVMMFPPEIKSRLNVESYKFPNIIGPPDYSSSQILTSSLLPTVHIIIGTNVTKTFSEQGIGNILRRHMSYKPARASHDVMLLFHALLLTKTCQIDVSSFSIVDIEIICLYCSPSQCSSKLYTNHLCIRSKSVSLAIFHNDVNLDIKFININHFSSQLEPIYTKTILYEGFSRNKYKDLDVSSVGPLFRNTQSYTQKLALISINIWTALVMNLTDEKHHCGVYNYHTYDGTCEFYTTMAFRTTTMDKSSVGFTIDHLNRSDSYQFIACGYIGSSSLAFDFLITSFDYKTWLGFGISVVIISGMITGIQICLSKKCNRHYVLVFLESVEALLCFFIERCHKPIDNLATRLGSSGKLVFIVISLLATILSNAYKNDNVRKMMLARYSNPIQTLQKLDKHEFYLYSILGDLGNITSELRKVNRWEINKKNGGIDGLHPGYGMFSYNLKVVAETTSFRREQLNSEERFAEKYIYEHVEIHPKMVNVFHDALRNSTLENFTNVGSWIARKEEEIIFEELVNCNNTAVVVPRRLRNILSTRLQATQSIKDFVWLGVESYFDSYSNYWISGFVHPFVITRIKSVYPSGILNWWMKSLHFNIKDKDRQRVLAGGNGMSGNILITFIIYWGGCLCAVAVFGIESLYSLSKLVAGKIVMFCKGLGQDSKNMRKKIVKYRTKYIATALTLKLCR